MKTNIFKFYGDVMSIAWKTTSSRMNANVSITFLGYRVVATLLGLLLCYWILGLPSFLEQWRATLPRMSLSVLILFVGWVLMLGVPYFFDCMRTPRDLYDEGQAHINPNYSRSLRRQVGEIASMVKP